MACRDARGSISWSTCCRQSRVRGRIPVFGGDQWRPFLHVDDAAPPFVQLLCLPPGRGAEIFNIGANSENYTIAQVGQIIKRIVPEAELVVDLSATIGGTIA